MQKKDNFKTALWFIPFVAVLLAGVFLFAYMLVVRVLHKSTTSKHPAPVQTAVPIVPVSRFTEEEKVVPPEVLADDQEVSSDQAQLDQPEVCAATVVPTKIQKSRRRMASTPYEQGLLRCKKQGIFPCAWEDKKDGMLKQYWLMSAQGPITRGVYDQTGNLLSETIATLAETVTSHTEQDVTWYFEAGVLVKIRTTPYDNCNFHDWFFIREDGKQDVCQCAYTTEDCCARSPYHEGMARDFCTLLGGDKDFCK